MVWAACYVISASLCAWGNVLIYIAITSMLWRRQPPFGGGCTSRLMFSRLVQAVSGSIASMNTQCGTESADKSA